MSYLYDVDAPKKATNLTVNSDLMAKAKALDVPLSSVMEEALEKVVRQKLCEQWLAENAAAVEEYNETIERHGVFSDGLRLF